jgi:alkylation response protein AidB-like acyl-CoA dehydrogenase
MHFALTTDQIELQQAARSFARKELWDLARELEDKDSPLPQDMQRTYGRLGFLAVNIPESFGGMGLGLLEALLVLEEFAQVSPAVAWPVFESLVGPVQVILRFGTAEMKQRLVPSVAAGEIVIAAAMSEPEAGTALTDLATTARKDGNELVIDGHKRWCSGGGHADAYLVYARMSPDPGARGIGAVLVENGRQGLGFGGREHLMGFRGIPTADIFLDCVRVPATNLIARGGQFGALMRTFGIERCGNATMALAIAAAAFEEALAYTGQRQQFGKPIVEFQAVQLKLADMAMKVEASRLLNHRAALSAVEGLPDAFQTSVAKCFANEIVREVTALGMQLMGGYGYSKSFRMEQRLRDAHAWGIAGGTTDIQKTNIVAGLTGRRFDQRR